MTIDATPPLIDYVENGVTLAHPVPFAFESNDEIVCTRIPVGDIEGDPLTQGVDYTVTGGGGGTGTVTKSSAGVVGTKFRVRRQTTRAQPTDYAAHDVFPAADTELALDRLAAVNQEQDMAATLLKRQAIRVPSDDIAAPLPKAAERASKFLHFSAAGAPEVLTAAQAAADLSAALTILMGMSFKGVPGSPGEGYPTRAEMAFAGNTASSLDDAYLTEGRRSGKFVFYSAAAYNIVYGRTLVADVTVDPQQGIFIAAESDATGAAGAWVRQFTGAKSAWWFGTETGAIVDDYTAIQAMFDVGGLMLLPAAAYRTSQQLKRRKFGILRGEGFGFDARLPSWRAMPGSVIIPDPDVDGIYFMNQAVIDDTNTVNSNTALYFVQEGSIWSEMSDIAVVAAPGGTTGTGFYIRAAAHLRNCHAIEMPGKGFDLSASGDVTQAGSEYGNDDTAVLDHCRAVSCGSHGFHLRGRDVNVVKLDTCNAIFNGGWGFLDDAEFANLYSNCHAAVNAGGSYKATSPVAAHTYLNCYVEGGVGQTADISDPAVIVGGNLAGACASLASSINLHSLGPQPAIWASPIAVAHQVKWDWDWSSPGAISGYCLTFRNGNYGLTHQGQGAITDHAFFNKDNFLAASVPTGTTNWNVGGDYYRAGVKVLGAAMGPIADVATTIALAAASPPTKAEFDSVVNAVNDIGVKFNALLAGFRQSTGHGQIVG